MSRLIIIISSIIILISCDHSTKVNFHYKKQGKGKPVIILESGLGGELKYWDFVQTQLSKETTTVSYERLGVGKSDSTKKVRTLENQTEELKLFLESNELTGPYILVGHSLGGYIIRSFQNKYPEDVLALVLIDPSNENQMDKMLALYTKEEADSLLNEMNYYISKLPEHGRKVMEEFENSSQKMKEISMPRNIPITLISAFKGLTAEESKAIDELNQEWKTEAPQMKIVNTEKSGHNIHLDEPDLVIEEILGMAKQFKE